MDEQEQEAIAASADLMRRALGPKEQGSPEPPVARRRRFVRPTWSDGLAPNKLIRPRPSTTDESTPLRIASARIPGDLNSLLAPPLSTLDHPATLPDIAKAIDRLMSAIDNDENIGIVSDHDVDGCTGHSVLIKALVGMMGVRPHRVVSYIGHRLREGYGLSDGVLARILATPQRPQVVITVDCGSSDEARISVLEDHGIDVIVTDHHEIPEAGPPASALACVSPARMGSRYPDPMIAGVMVAWLLMAALRTRMKETERLRPDAPGMASLLDYVALATVADCVSLGESRNHRAVARYGLQMIGEGCRPCWKAIRRRGWLGAPSVSARDLAFAIGPRINARGRLDEAMTGVMFLIARTAEEADDFARVLENENDERKGIERKLIEEAVEQADSMREPGAKRPSLWLEKRGGRAFGAIWFRALAPGDAELPVPGETLRLLYTPAWNRWNGERRVQVVVEGWCLPSPTCARSPKLSGQEIYRN